PVPAARAADAHHRAHQPPGAAAVAGAPPHGQHGVGPQGRRHLLRLDPDPRSGAVPDSRHPGFHRANAGLLPAEHGVYLAGGRTRPLTHCRLRKQKGVTPMSRKAKFLLMTTVSLVAMAFSVSAFAQVAAPVASEATVEAARMSANAWIAIAAGLAIALAAFGGALGQAKA